jgi:hypothetical protein
MTTPTTTILPPETYGPQTVTSGETLLSQHAQSTTIIQDTGGFYTFGVNDVVSTTTGAQIGDLLGDGFTIDATNPGGVAVQLVGSNEILEGNILSANDSVGMGGGDLVTGSGANNLTIEGNTFEGTGNWLAYVNGALDTYTASTNVNFINNTFTGTATAGADISDDAASGTISGNTFSGSGSEAIFLGTISAAVANAFNAAYGTTYVPVPGTITVTGNNFSGWVGADVSTYDASYTFAHGGAGVTFTDTVTGSGQEIDKVTGWTGGTISSTPASTPRFTRCRTARTRSTSFSRPATRSSFKAATSTPALSARCSTRQRTRHRSRSAPIRSGSSATTTI